MKQRNIQSIHNPYPYKRDAFEKIKAFMDNRDNSPNYSDKVLILCGLKRTGKTTLLEQLISEIKDEKKCSYYLVDSNDTMADVEDVLEAEQKKDTRYVIFDEITNINGFIDEAAFLSDLYSKEGVTIILSGTDSLGFNLANRNSLMGKNIGIKTTHIPFAEYSRVLGVSDIDEYIKYGGLMPDGNENYFVDDYASTEKYLAAVADNISNSLKKAPSTNNLEKFSKDELSIMVNKVVEKYSGQFDEKILQNELKKASVTYVNEKLSNLDVDGEFIHYMNRESTKKDIAKDFLPIINASGKIREAVNADDVEWLIQYLTDMEVLSTTITHTYTKSANNVWGNRIETNEYYIVQPAIKYYHLIEAKKFIEKSEWYNALSYSDKSFLSTKLEEKIMGDMLEQITLYDTICYLSNVKYINDGGIENLKYNVCKPKFIIDDGEITHNGEYDMLICDNELGMYYAFEIKHSKEAVSEQYKHLNNPEILEIVNKQYGAKQENCVLYRGTSFQSADDVVYLNINEFLMSLGKSRDIHKTMLEMTVNLPTKDMRINEVDENKDIEEYDR